MKLLHFAFFSLAFSTIVFASQKAGTTSVALVLNVIGDSASIDTVSSFHFTSFNGRVKDKYPKKNSSVIKVTASDEKEQIFEGYFDNPMATLIEAYHEDGTMERLDLKQKSEYLNIRFGLGEKTSRITFRCYFLVNGKWKLISEFNQDIG